MTHTKVSYYPLYPCHTDRYRSFAGYVTPEHCPETIHSAFLQEQSPQAIAASFKDCLLELEVFPCNIPEPDLQLTPFSEPIDQFGYFT